MEKLTIIQPDDWHLHVRSGSILKAVIPATAKQFARAIIMPNLNPPVTTVDQALEYRKEILQAIPASCNFQPLMTLYLTNATSVSDVQAAAAADTIHAFKLYPAGATTNSDSGVTSLAAIYPVLEAMQKYDLPLLIHGEVTDNEVDIFDRESVFIDTILVGVVADFPELRIVLEHVTTREAVQFVTAAADNVAATITPQHLLLNRNAILAGGIRPHNYCLPVLKRESHRQALVNAAISGNRKFFLGTDSAPHFKHLKESGCGCAGCYSAPAALALYAEIFEQAQALDKLEGFASLFGADFYRLPRNTTTISLTKSTWNIPESYPLGADQLVPLFAGESINWQIQL